MAFIERAREADITLILSGGATTYYRGASDTMRGTALVATFAASGSGSEIFVGPGKFNIGASVLTTPANFTMRGAGREATIIEGSAVGALAIAGVGPCRLEGFTLSSTVAGGIAGVVSQAAMSVTVRDVAFLGQTDGLALMNTVLSGSGRFDHCRFYASVGEGLVDNVGDYLGEIIFDDCEFETAEPTGVSSALWCGGYKLRAYDCQIKSRGGGTAVIGLKFLNTQDRGIIRGCIFDVAKTGGSPTVNDVTVTGDGAVLTANNCKGSAGNDKVVATEATSGVFIEYDSGYVLQGKTTDATTTELTSPSRFVLTDETTYACDVIIVARQDTGVDNAMYRRMVLITRTGGTVALEGAVQTIGTDIEGDANWAVTLTADDTNKSLKVEVTGAAAHNVHWVAKIDAIKTAYAD